EPVAERPILRREHLVSGVADDRVPERILAIAGEPRDVAALHDLATRELTEPVVDLARLVLTAGQRKDARAPEELAEDARGAQDATGHRIEALETRLDHREHGRRQRPRFVGRRHR